MKHDLIKVPANHCGFTDVFTITHADLTAATDDLAQTITLDALAFGDMVYAAAIEIQTAFDAASADEATTAALGVTSATTQFLAAFTFVTGGAGVAAKTGACQGETFAPYITPTGGKDILLTVDITDADGALVDHSAGVLLIWMQISRWADRVGNRQIG